MGQLPNQLPKATNQKPRTKIQRVHISITKATNQKPRTKIQSPYINYQKPRTNSVTVIGPFWGPYRRVTNPPEEVPIRLSSLEPRVRHVGTIRQQVRSRDHTCVRSCVVPDTPQDERLRAATFPGSYSSANATRHGGGGVPGPGRTLEWKELLFYSEGHYPPREGISLMMPY